MATMALTLVAVSVQAATVEQEIDSWSKLVSKDGSTYQGHSDASDLTKARYYGDEVLRGAVDSMRSNDLAESDYLKEVIDLDHKSHLGEWKDHEEEHFHTIPTPVPEAETSVMMLIGVGLIAFIARRRHKFL